MRSSAMMEFAEATKELKTEITVIESMIQSNKNFESKNDCENLVRKKNILQKAIEALEKQTPRKPDFIADGYADGVLVYDTWLCPNCEQAYEVEYDKYDFCPRCGQKIDWSEQNDEEENS